MTNNIATGGGVRKPNIVGANHRTPCFVPPRMIVGPSRFDEVAPTLYKNGWHAVPLHSGTKVPLVRWSGANQGIATKTALSWVRKFPDAACGIAVSAAVLAIDIDVLEESTAATVLEVATRALGPPDMLRIGRWPKTMLFYGVAETGSICSRKLHPIELFSGTCQVALFGRNEKAGRPYAWSARNPLNVTMQDLRKSVTPRQLEAFLGEALALVAHLRPGLNSPQADRRPLPTTSDMQVRSPHAATLNALMNQNDGRVRPGVTDFIAAIGRQGLERHSALLTVAGRKNVRVVPAPRQSTLDVGWGASAGAV